MRLSDAELRRPKLKLIYPNHRLFSVGRAIRASCPRPTRRVRGVTLTLLTDFRPLPLPVAILGPVCSSLLLDVISAACSCHVHGPLQRELRTFFRPQIHEMLQTVQLKGIWNLTVLFFYRPRISKVRYNFGAGHLAGIEYLIRRLTVVFEAYPYHVRVFVRFDRSLSQLGIDRTPKGALKGQPKLY
jgi:hypothetical protein